MSGLQARTSDSTAGPLADWALAERIARLIALRDQPDVTRVEVDQLRAELRATAARADELARTVTGLGGGLPPATVRVVSRGAWLRSNIASIAWLVDPMAEQLMDRSDMSRALARKALGAQLGLVFGYLATKVLGQYEVLLPDDEEPGRLTLVGPNLVQLERDFLPTVRVSSGAFRMGVVLHELAHRLQFEGVDWLRPTLRQIVSSYLAATRLDTDRLRATVDRMGELLRSARSGLNLQQFLEVVLTPAQRELMARAQAMISLLEGHGKVVMDWGAQLLDERGGAGFEAAGVRQALNERRRRGADRVLFNLLGLSLKAQQYSVGEQFIMAVERGHGRDVFNRVWRDPGNPPSLDELEQPHQWVPRVSEGPLPGAAGPGPAVPARAPEPGSRAQLPADGERPLHLAAGEGVAIDRLVMLLTGMYSIRHDILFPLLRPEEPGESGQPGESTQAEGEPTAGEGAEEGAGASC